MTDEKPSKSSEELNESEHPRSLVVYGGGGHGKSIIEMIQAIGSYEITGVIDDVLAPGTMVMGVPVLGNSQVLEELHSKGVLLAVNAVGGIGDLETRVKIFQVLKDADFDFPTLIHPSATVEPSARLSGGTQILPHAYIGTQALLGFGVIVNNGAIVSHDCQIGDYSGLAPGAMLAGEVKIGESVQIGMGVTINLKISIGDGSLIGNSAVIKRDVPANTVIHAGSVWPQRE